MTAAAFAGFDAVVVSTAHDGFRDPELYVDVPLVIDTRNLFARMKAPGPGRPRIVKA